MAPPTASSGIETLDHALGGLFWGDNVVWELEEDAALAPFVSAVAGAAPGFGAMAHVVLDGGPAANGMEPIDASAGTPLDDPDALLEAVRAWCAERPQSFVLFDPLEAMSGRWGDANAQRFFARACPLLLELGAIAYWSLVSDKRTRELRRVVEEITQCILVVDGARLRVAKCDGRAAALRGNVFDYRVEGGRPVLTTAAAATRVGAALRTVRAERNLTQTDLARTLGISPSAISQAERGKRGLSLETLLTLADRLGLTLDQLLQGSESAGHRLGRRDHPRTPAEAVVLPLLDDPRAGLRVFLVSLPPGASADAGFAHKGVETVAVASGLVQVVLGRERTVLRGGEAMLAESSAVTGWRNLGDSRAVAFWTLRD